MVLALSLTARLRHVSQISVVRSSTAMMLSSLIMSGFGYVFWMVAAHLLPVADVGLASGSIATMSSIGSMSTVGMNYAAQRFLPAAGTASLRLARLIQGSVLLIGLTAGAASLLGEKLWSGSADTLGLLFALGIGSYAICMTQDSVLLGLGRAAWIPVENALNIVGKLILLVAGAAGGGQWTTAVYAWIISMIVASCVTSIMIERAALPRRRSPQAQVPSVSQIAHFAAANYAGSTLLLLPSLLYPALVLRFLGKEQTAYFYTSWMIAGLLMLLSTNIASAMVAQATGSNADRQSVMTVAARYSMVTVLAGVAGIVAAGPALLFAFGARYEHGYPALVVLSLACPIYALNSYYSGILRVRCQQLPVLLQGATSAAVSLALAWPLSHIMGLPGFGAAFLVGQLAAAAVTRRAVTGGFRQTSAPAALRVTGG